MSEIKGQLFGILLTAVIIATVGVTIYGIFDDLTTKVKTKVTETTSTIMTPPTEALHTKNMLTY